jgi:Response regulator of the LytR/AlgR family
MQVEIKLDETCTEPKVIILVDKLTDEINEIIKRLSETHIHAIAGFKGDSVEVLQPEEIIRIYAENQKVYAQTEQGTYLVKLRLYELEEKLDKDTFLRISNSEIINLKQMVSLDLSLAGTICVRLRGNSTTYVSRRYVARIKQFLGI